MTATKAVIIFCLLMVFLTGLGLWAGFQMWPPEERHFTELTASDRALPHDKFWEDANYKKLRLAFLPFDLTGGLTRQNWQALPVNSAWGIFWLWITFGLVLILVKPR